MRPPSPTQRIRGWHAYLLVWRVHRALGLGVGVLIMLMSLTGGLLVLHDELDALVAPERHHVTETSRAAPAAPLNLTVQRVASEAPAGYRPLRFEPGHDASKPDKLLFVAADGRTRWLALVHPKSGETLWSGSDQAYFSTWLLHLHMHLRVGGWGYAVTSVAGIALVVLGLSGLFIYRERFSALMRHPFRLELGWRVALGDLHRWLGVVSIYFSLVLGTTGAIYALTTAPKQIAAPRPLAAAFPLPQLTPIEPVVATARARFPAAELTRIAFPTTTKASLVVTVLHRDAPVWRKFSRIEFDSATGAVRSVSEAAAAPARQQFAAMLSPLHFGFYGSQLTKVLYAIGGFAPFLLGVTGLALWRVRTRRARTAMAAGSA